MPPGHYPIVPPLGELSNVVISVKEVESILKNLDPSKSPRPDGLTSRLVKEVASEISSPITNIFNKSLNSGIFPTKWKDSNLTPVFKSGQKDVITNYRGIALLPVLSKVLERCVHSRILKQIEPYLSPSQHGFRRYRSCVTQLPGGGHSSEFLVGVCRPVLQILTQFQTKIIHFPHPQFQT